MIGRKSILGLCMLCALAIAGLAAQSASAQKAYTCAETGTQVGANKFSDSHCKTPNGTTGPWRHVAFTGKTNITGSGEVTKLKSVQSGVTLELQSTELTGSGEMENKEEGATTWAEGTGTITYKNVTVTLPAGKGCKVVGGSVTTNKLAATTKGLTNQLKFTPATGETFAEFTVEGCSIGALNHLYTAKGSVIGNTEGATTVTTHNGTSRDHSSRWSMKSSSPVSA